MGATKHQSLDNLGRDHQPDLSPPKQLHVRNHSLSTDTKPEKNVKSSSQLFG